MFWFLLKLFFYLLISGILFFWLGWRLREKRAQALIESKERKLDEEYTKRERTNELLVRAEADRDRAELKASRLREGAVAKEDFDKLETEFTSSSMELSRLRDERARQEVEVAKLTEKLLITEDTLKRTTRECDDFSVELAHLRGRGSSFTDLESDALAVLRKEVDEKNKSLAILIDEKEALEQRQSLTKPHDSADLLGMRRMLNDAKVALGQSVSELTDSKSKVKELEGRLVSLESGSLSAREMPGFQNRIHDLEDALAKEKRISGDLLGKVNTLESDARQRGAGKTEASDQELRARVESLQSKLQQSGGSDLREIARLKSERDEYRSQLELLKANLATQTTHMESGQGPDDLTKIKGIAKVLSEKLHAYGIYTYQQIADWDAEERDTIDTLLSFAGRIQRDRWQEQARELMAAKQQAGVS